MTKEEAHAIMDEALDKLGEHFDAVQICASTHEDAVGTDPFFRGGGNFYARRALCETFSRRDQSSEAAQFIAQELNPKED